MPHTGSLTRCSASLGASAPCAQAGSMLVCGLVRFGAHVGSWLAGALDIGMVARWLRGLSGRRALECGHLGPENARARADLLPGCPWSAASASRRGRRPRSADGARDSPRSCRRRPRAGKGCARTAAGGGGTDARPAGSACNPEWRDGAARRRSAPACRECLPRPGCRARPRAPRPRWRRRDARRSAARR